MQQKQGYHAAKIGLSCSKNRAIMQQKQGYHAAETGLSYDEKSKKEGQCPRGNYPFAL